MQRLKIDVYAEGNPPDTEYLIERSTDPNFQSDVVVVREWSKETVFIDTVEGGLVFYYRSRARKAEESTPYSPPATIESTPVTPRNFRVTNVTSQTMTLSWESSRGAIDYTLYRNNEKIYEGPNMSFQDSGLSPNTNYAYAIVAKNNTGTSERSELTQMTLPLPVEGFEITSVTDTTIGLSWSKEDGAIYELRRNSIMIYRGDLGSFTDAGLMPGTEYTYELIQSVDGSSANPVQLKAITTIMPPLNFLATNVRTNGLSLSWTPIPSIDVSYELRRGTNTIFNGVVTNFEDTGLVAGDTYTYYVIAKTNRASSSPARLTVTMIPEAIQRFEAIDVGHDYIELEWDQVKGAKTYEIRREGQVIYSGSASSFKDENLSSNQLYHYIIVPKNDSGAGNPTSLSVRTEEEIRGMEPKNVQATSTETSVQITWEHSDTGIIYGIDRDGKRLLTTSNDYYTDSNLDPDTLYQYTITGFRGSESSSPVPVSIRTKLSTPVIKIRDDSLMPQNVQFQNITDKSVTVSWDNEPGVTYTITRDGRVVYSGTGSNVTLNDHDPATSYEYAVMGETDDRISPPHEERITTRPATPDVVEPDPPKVPSLKVWIESEESMPPEAPEIKVWSVSEVTEPEPPSLKVYIEGDASQSPPEPPELRVLREDDEDDL